MIKLEDINAGDQIEGLAAGEIVRVIAVEPLNDNAITIYYKPNQGRPDEQMLTRSDESRLSFATTRRSWSFNAPGHAFKLGLEAYRISQAYLFDPMMAIHSSNVEPLPHQISAVYEHMLPRQPLKFILADDPGAGKTIMAGLLIRELIMRADVRRVLIVPPGSLCEQWQMELKEKFGLVFDIFSREKQEQCASGNYFQEQPMLIARMDQLARNDEYRALLENTEWDLVIVDEAHKMSAHFFGKEPKPTKRFKLGQSLHEITRHFLLMTATPHNGKEEDFQLFLSLLDPERFSGKFREGVHEKDVGDLMRRMVKEDLRKFDGSRLFPDRYAYTARYELSHLEDDLYKDVTNYVRNEMNRAERLDGKTKSNVGFALTQLQRRLASSPEAIYQSLKRRRKRLENKLEEVKSGAKGPHVAETLEGFVVSRPIDIPDDIDDIEDELNAEEYEAYAEQITDRATASETIPQLETEIEILRGLEEKAGIVVHSEEDRKWEELSRLLQETPEMKHPGGGMRKLIVFTEYKDTLNYLYQRISGLLGSSESVTVIHGGVKRDDRREAQEKFRHVPEVLVMVATDAAGEGVNLQNASLMINYDLPWNPNRLEQRFGRIHRIGQTEICRLWNLVASRTREGQVFERLFEKLEIERNALGGRVFDILGKAFENVSLKELLIRAIRSEENADTDSGLLQTIDETLDTERLKEILRSQALVENPMSMEDLFSVRDEMDKAEARKLQPYFIRSFFAEAFSAVNGEMRARERGRWEIRHVPAAVREKDREIGSPRIPVVHKYERVCFEKEHITLYGKPPAEFLHPAHPLMRAATELALDAHRAKLKQGAVLMDPNDGGEIPKMLFMIDHAVREGSGEKQKAVSRQIRFVAISPDGAAANAGWAPHLDLEPLSPDDMPHVKDILESPWISKNLEMPALNYAAGHLAPEHYREVKSRLERQAGKILDAVNKRLVAEINYHSKRYEELKQAAAAGKQPKMQPENVRRIVEKLTARLERRRRELEAMKNVVSATPVIVGGALVIPKGWLARRKGETGFTVSAEARARIERAAMTAVMEAEHALGFQTRDVSANKWGWDITSEKFAEDGTVLEIRHIEVKGRAKGQPQISVSRNEIIEGLNQGDKYILAIVIVDGETHEEPRYIRRPFEKEPDFAECGKAFDLKKLLSRAVNPVDSVN